MTDESLVRELTPGTPVMVYTRLLGTEDDADTLGGLVRCCYRRNLVVMGVHVDVPATGTDHLAWYEMVGRVRAMDARAIVTPGQDHVHPDPMVRTDRLRAAQRAGASVRVPPPGELDTRPQTVGARFGAVVRPHPISHVTNGAALVERHRAVPIEPPHMLPDPPPVTWTTVKQVMADLDLAHQLRDEDRPFVVVVRGPAGSGKTTAALNWLSSLEDALPDGELYVDLASTGNGPRSPQEALRTWLPALGLSRQHIPSTLAEQQAWFGAYTAPKTLGIVVENAISAAQVRTLIPTSSSSVLVVTTRERLTGLGIDNAEFVEIAPQPADGQ